MGRILRSSLLWLLWMGYTRAMGCTHLFDRYCLKKEHAMYVCDAIYLLVYLSIDSLD
jgi:hypothetical protein